MPVRCSRPAAGEPLHALCRGALHHEPALAPKLPPEEQAKLGIDIQKDKMFVLGYIAIAILAIPVV